LRLTVSQTRRRFSTASDATSASRSCAPAGGIGVTATLGDEQIVQAPRGGGITEYCAAGAEKQVEHRPLGPGGLFGRGWKQPRSVALNEIECELSDPLELSQHADQYFRGHRVRPCT
jgi:hypothetical protein